MDGWIEILVFVAFVVGGMLLDKRQKRSDSADTDGGTAMTGEAMPHEAPEEVQPAAVRRQPVRTKHKAADNAARTIPVQPPTAATGEEQSEFALKDADDVRRAVVWSEILRRKY